MIKKILAVPLLVLILATSLGLMLWASLTDSGTMDELAHIPSGYSYMEYRDFRLNPEHPPLVKDLAGLPLTFMDLNFPTDHRAYTEEVNSQWWMGSLFLYDSGNDPDAIIRWARVGPMLITLALILLTYIWSAEIMGALWALFPTAFLALSPIILAHGHYVTTDLGAAFGILLSLYLFVRYVRAPSTKRLVWAGVGFGIAQLLKFSAVLLIPQFIFIALMLFLDRSSRAQGAPQAPETPILREAARWVGRLISIFAIGFALVAVVYAWHMPGYPTTKQRSDTEFILNSFAHGPDPSWEACSPTSGVGLSRRVRCLADITIWLSDKPVIRGFGHYMLGVLMVMQRSAGGNSSYFLGQFSSSGWWYYFPLLFLTKEAIASLIILISAFGVWLRIFIRNLPLHAKASAACKSLWTRTLHFASEHTAEFALATFAAFYWLYSMRSNLNIGVRHVIPTIPLLYILAWKTIRLWMGSFSFATLHRSVFKISILALLTLTLVISTLITAPLFLSSFNILGGGDANGYQIAVDSNYDWGQDLKRLDAWVDARNSDSDPTNDIKKIAVDYFGAGSPRYYLGDLFEPWSAWKGNPINQGIQYLAVSATFLQGSIAPLAKGEQRRPEDEYSWIQNPHQPYARIGTSIFIYR